MKLRWTIPAVCVLALAAAVAVFRHDGSPAADRAPGTPRHRDKGTRPELADRSAAGGGESQAPAAGGNDAQVADAAVRHALRRQSRQAEALRATPSRAELERRAQLVEQETNHELDHLIPLLDLTPAQQERVFQALAGSSQHFVPGMQVNGTPLQPSTGSPQQAVLAELSPGQQEAYQQDTGDSSDWWREYLGNATAMLENGVPAVSAPAVIADVPDSIPAADTTPAAKEAHLPAGDE